jgi:hypothetical protein
MPQISLSRAPVASSPAPPRSAGKAAFWIAIFWALGLAALFFAGRGNDVGRLPELLVTFVSQFRGFDPGILRDSAFGGVIAILVVLSWIGIGDLMERLLDRFGGADRKCEAWHWAKACAWGAGASSLLWFFLGLAGCYTQPLAAGVLLVGLLLFAKAWGGRRLQASATEQLGLTGRLAFALVGATMLMASIASLAPPTAKDTLLYHIALPKVFLAARGLADVPNNIAQYYALGAEMNGVWAMLLGRLASARAGEAAFGATEFAYLPGLALAIYGWSRRLGYTRDTAWVAVALTICIPTVYVSASSGYNDMAFAVYLTIAIAAAAEFWQTPSRWSAADLGLAMGFALGVKLLALFLAAPLALMFLLRMRKGERSPIPGTSATAVLRAALLSAGLAIMLAAPWYVRNWARTGSPVYPFYSNLFGGRAPGWDKSRSLIDQVLNARYGGHPKSALDYLAVPVRVSLLAQPEIPRYFDGVLGISFLFALPFLFLLRSKNREPETGNSAPVYVALALAGGFFVFWLFSSEQLRYLLPVLPAVAVGIAGVASAPARRQRALLLATVAPGILVIGAWFLQQNPLPVLMGGESRQSFLERRVDHYRFYEAANQLLPANARLWLIDMRGDTYYLDRPYFFDFRIEHYTLMQLVRSSDSIAELNQQVRSRGISYVLARTDLLLDYATSPIVDDTRPREENERKLRLLRQFLLGSEVLKRDDHFVLFKVE